MRVSRRGVPMAAILTSTVVGFLCVLAAAVSPGTVFLFLLNSSGAIILFVYLLIALSQLVLRRKAAPGQLKVKMWFYPWLTLLTIGAIIAVLVLMFLDASTRQQLVLSLVAWAAVLVCYGITKWRGGSVGVDSAPADLPADAAAAGSRRPPLADTAIPRARKEFFDDGNHAVQRCPSWQDHLSVIGRSGTSTSFCPL